MICVYDIDNDNYTGNGDAVLIPTDCPTKMIAGGNYDLQMTHPIDPDGKWKHLVPGAIIKIPVPYEEIENAWSGYEADVYKTNGNRELREGPSAPQRIVYQEWGTSSVDPHHYNVGDKVTYSGASHRNYQCVYYDSSSPIQFVPPAGSSWWKQIPDWTSGSPVLVTLPTGTDLYLVEDYNTSWYKMSTYYGIVGYIQKSYVTYDRHLTPEETQPRIITTQLLRITSAAVDTKTRTVSVTAQHVSYDLNGIIVKDVNIQNASPAMAIGRIVEGLMITYPGSIATNLDSEENGTYTEQIKGKTGMYCLLDPDKGITNTFGAAFKRDNWDLYILQQTETDRGFRLRYRKNMLGVNWAKKSDQLITRVVPVAKNTGGEDLYLPEEWVDSPLINSYPIIRMERLTVKGQVGKDKGLGDGSTWTEEDLLDEMRAKAGERFSVDHADEIVQEVTVDFEMLGDTAEHAEIRELEQVLLYDMVGVINEEIGLEEQLMVTEMEWDPIRQKVKALKLSNTIDHGGKNVTGYNIIAKSIGTDKLTDDVADGILQQVLDIVS